MSRELALAGFRLTGNDWDELDADTQQELLATLGVSDPDELAIDPPYESFELRFE